MSYFLFSQHKGFFNKHTHSWSPYTDIATAINEVEKKAAISSIATNCTFVKSASVKNLTFEDMINLLVSKISTMTDYDMADAFNNCCDSDMAYDENECCFFLDGEEINSYELLSNLKAHLKYQTAEDVLDIYEQIFKSKVFYFCDSDIYINKI